MKKKGIVLPLVMVLSLILLTAIGVWYRKVIVQGYLAERLVQQRIAFKECTSLLPILKKRTESLSIEELKKTDNQFFKITVQKGQQWVVSRSAWLNGKIVFEFRSHNKSQEPVRLTIWLEREEH